MGGVCCAEQKQPTLKRSHSERGFDYYSDFNLKPMKRESRVKRRSIHKEKTSRMINFNKVSSPNCSLKTWVTMSSSFQTRTTSPSETLRPTILSASLKRSYLRLFLLKAIRARGSSKRSRSLNPFLRRFSLMTSPQILQTFLRPLWATKQITRATIEGLNKKG